MKKKKLFLTTVALVMSFQSLAQTRFQTFSRVSLKDRFEASVDVNNRTVRCSSVGYGVSELKINVPGLKWNAVFDHSNAENLGPCMTAGVCRDDIINVDGLTPDDLIQDDPGRQNIVVRRLLKERFQLDHFDKTCSRTLTESLDTVIRGHEFTHTVSKQIGDLPFQSCLDLVDSEKASVF